MRCIVALLMIMFTLPLAKAQIFPGLDGEELEQALRDDYTPTFLLDDTYYGRSTNENFPIVISPYTGNTEHTVTFKPAS